MLRSLHIRDFVLVDALELELAEGFSALTGETGAGKSILVDALSLALGERADPGIIRHGAARAEVAAEFDLPAQAPERVWLAAHDIEADDALLLRRVVDAGGRSRAWINGTPVTLAQVRELAAGLADIHGQHAHHALLQTSSQRGVLDAHAGLCEALRELAAAHKDWRRLRDALEAAQRDADARSRERDMLAWQVEELEALAFDADAWSATNQEHRRLSHAGALLEGVDQALATLEEGESAVERALGDVAVQLRRLAELDAQLAEAGALVDSAAIQVREAVHVLRQYADRTELDPDRLAELEQRIAAVTALARKHRVTPEELASLAVDLRARLDELSLQADPVRLAQACAESKARYHGFAARVSEARRAAALRLSEQVSASMHELGMAGGVFEVALTPRAEPAAYGVEDVEFLVSANAGRAPAPLAKVASGGELSRIGLAIQVIASAAGGARTLVFDEVDVGIGGRVAEIVGRLLRALGQERQVLCVTHLPQVAACADHQWCVGKESTAQGAVTRIVALDGETRVGEIARMLGGVSITDTTRRHAEEMLRTAGGTSASGEGAAGAARPVRAGGSAAR